MIAVLQPMGSITLAAMRKFALAEEANSWAAHALLLKQYLMLPKKQKK
jgi:hypothetical protein